VSDLSRVEKPGSEGGKVYPGDGLDTEVKPGSSNDSRPYPPGQEKAVAVRAGSSNDAR
jgi:hypothetical protein